MSATTPQFAPPAPGARGFTGLGAAAGAGLARCVGGAVAAFTLAAIADMQAESDAREEVPRFCGADPAPPGRPWLTLEDLDLDRPRAGVTRPVTMSTDAKVGLAALLAAAADVARAAGGYPVAPAALAATAWREACAVRLMLAATAQMRPILRAGQLSRDFDFPSAFSQKLEAVTGLKGGANAGAGAMARLFVDFVKVVSWHAAVGAYEGGRHTLNRAALCGILGAVRAVVPEADGAAARDALSYARDQMEAAAGAAARARALAAKTRAAAAAALASRRPARPAGPAAAAGADAAAVAAAVAAALGASEDDAD